MNYWVTYPPHDASLQPRIHDQGGADPLLPGGRSSRILRHRLHRPPRSHGALVEGRRPRCTRPVRRALVLCCRHGPDATDPEHPRPSVPQPLRGGQVGGDHRRAVGRAFHPRRGHRLHARRVPGARRGLRRAQCPLRRGDRGHPRHLERGRTTSTRAPPSRPGDRRPTPSRHRTRRSGSGATAACRVAVSPATATAGAPFPPPGSSPTPPRRRRSRPWIDLRVMLDELAQFMEEAGRDPEEHRHRVRHGRRRQPGQRLVQPRGPRWRATPSWRRWASPGPGQACPGTPWPSRPRGRSSASEESVIR